MKCDCQRIAEEAKRPGFVVVVLVSAAIASAVWIVGGAGFGGSIAHLELTIVAILFSGIVGSIVGFAFSAIAAALLAHLYPDPVELVRVLLVCSITIQAYCTLMLLKSIRWREIAPYLTGGLLTAPVGVFLLTRVSSHVYALGLGAFLGFGIYRILTNAQFRAVLLTMVVLSGGMLMFHNW